MQLPIEMVVSYEFSYNEIWDEVNIYVFIVPSV